MHFNKRYRIVVGGSRIVFLCSRYVVKFARIKLLKTVILITQYLLWLSSGREKCRNYIFFVEMQKAGALSTTRFFFEYAFLNGIEQNKLEWERWNALHSEELVPVLFGLAGIINVQMRAMQCRPLGSALIQKAHADRVMPLGSIDDYADNKGYYIDPETGEMSVRWIDYGYRTWYLECANG